MDHVREVIGETPGTVYGGGVSRTSTLFAGAGRVRDAAARRFTAALQVLMCEAVLVCYFLSIWKFKIWFIGTAAAVAITALVVITGAVHVRGLVRDVWPFGGYFLYLLAASFQSEHGDEARYWTLVDSAGILVTALFWIAARNATPQEIRRGLAHVALVAAAIALAIYRSMPDLSRLGGYALPFNPVVLPFLWTDIVGRTRHRRLAIVTIAVVLSLILLGRSRAPLGAGALALGLSFLWISRGLVKRLKFALLLTILVIGSLAVLSSFYTTRVLLLTFVARVTHEDVILGDIYVPGEPLDPVRGRLNDIVRDTMLDAQPFGIGYSTAGRIYERRWGEFVPLHSMYQTWLVEGGVICVGIMLAILIRQFFALRVARRMASTPEESAMARCITIAIVAVLFIGLFHQMHQGPVFYAVMGLGLGFRERMRVRLKARRDSTPPARRQGKPAEAAERA